MINLISVQSLLRYKDENVPLIYAILGMNGVKYSIILSSDNHKFNEAINYRGI